MRTPACDPAVLATLFDDPLPRVRLVLDERDAHGPRRWISHPDHDRLAGSKHSLGTQPGEPRPMQAVGDDETTARERALHAFAVDAADRRREILALEGHRSLLYPVTGELIAN